MSCIRFIFFESTDRIINENPSMSMDLESGRLINMPKCDFLLTPIIYTIPLQILSYEVALLRGTDIDQPRNLAKSVTVE